MKKNRSSAILKDKDEIKKVEEFLNDGFQEKWEKKELGKSLEHAVGEKANTSGAPTSIRLSDSYIRIILTEDVK